MTATADTTGAGELEAIRRTFRIINRCVWSVAAGVMVYGAPIAYGLLVEHDVPEGIAWMLSLLVDAALVVGLVATPILARYGIPAGWVGMLRWVSGLFTWALQTTGSWIKQDGIGVLLHSLGPVILFVVVEAAAYFQRKMSAKIAELEAATRRVDDQRAATQAELADLRQRLATVTADRDTHLRRAEQLAAETASATSGAETVAASERARADAAEAEIADLRRSMAEQIETLRLEHSETVRRLRAQHTAKLAEVRAEASTVRLSDYRRRTSDSGNGGPGRNSAKPAAKTRLSDEDAVQALYDAHDDPGFEWSKAEVQRVTGCGWDRIPKLLDLLSDFHLRRSSEVTSDGTSEEGERTA